MFVHYFGYIAVETRDLKSLSHQRDSILKGISRRTPEFDHLTLGFVDQYRI